MFWRWLQNRIEKIVLRLKYPATDSNTQDIPRDTCPICKIESYILTTHVQLCHPDAPGDVYNAHNIN